MKYRAFIVEDSPTIRDNLMETLQELAEVEFVGTAETEHDGKRWFAGNDEAWDVAIVDLFHYTTVHKLVAFLQAAEREGART